MKNFYSIFALSAAGLAMTTQVNAQIYTAGLPLSIQKGIVMNDPQTHIYENPVTEEKLIALAANKENMTSYVALFSETDLKFPESGEFHYTPDGSIIWKAKFTISDAAAIGMYFDNFVLPKGVSMYASNANGRQLLGAYTIENNSDVDTKFAVEAVQGSTVNIELNIAPFVDISQIHLNMNRAAVYFTGINYLQKYVVGESLIRDPFEGGSSSCMIEAKCETAHFDISLDASLQTLYTMGQGVSSCSGTMVNNTDNTSTLDCKQYVLTASHCQSNASGIGDTINTAFSQTLFRYNFQKVTCTSTADAEVKTITGAYLKARSPYNGNLPTSAMLADFMLLELRSKVPENWGTKLVGWDINVQSNYSNSTDERYVGFHHPAGDIKKTSWSKNLIRSAREYSIEFPDDASRGAIARGSSGSGLFNNNNKVIAIASTAGNDDPNCGGGFSDPNRPDFLLYINYYRVSHGWEFSNNPAQQLKVWLDPTNSGATTAPTVTTFCNHVAGGGNSITGTAEEFASAISVYPNPSNGLLSIKLNLNNAKDVTIEVYNVVGAKVNSYSVGNVSSATKELDLSHLNSGVYLVKLTDGTNVATKKITISK